MTVEEIIPKINTSEFRFSTSRSSGPGGQNVNKVNTRVELRLNIPSSSSFSDEEKTIITDKLKNRINNEGDLLIVSQSERTQLRNKEKAIERLYSLLAGALTVKPKRKATKPSQASKAKRVDEKKKRGLIKSLRKDTGTDF